MKFKSKSNHLLYGKEVLIYVNSCRVGPGNPRYLTVDVVEKIKEAETIIAFGRVGHSIKPLEMTI